jgi:hypothetical protein
MPVAGQETRGAIEGTVKDSSGGVLPGVNVTATTAGGAVQTTVTDAKGVFHFPALPPATYTVKATLSGFTTGVVDNVKVTLGQLFTVSLTLSIAGRSESVEVRAETPIIDLKQNSVTQTITADMINLIPKSGTGILGAISGLPGAGNESRLGGLGIDGAGASENRYIIDGMDASNLQNGTLGKDLNINFVDQIQVKQSGYNAEYRAATGGVVSAVTKSGTNTFHGDADLFLSGRPLAGLQGTVRPSIRLVPSDPTQTTTEYIANPRLNETTTTNPTLNVNGPILKSRLWFFVGYNPQVSEQRRNITWTTNNAGGPALQNTKQSFDSKTSDTTYLYNASAQVRSNLRVRFNANNERQTSGLGLPNIDSGFGSATYGTSSTNATTFNPRQTLFTKSFNNSYSGVVDWVWNSTTYINVTTGLLSYGSGSAGGDYYHGIRRTFSGSNINLLDVPVSLQQANGFADNNANSFTVKNNFQRYDVNADITKYVTWHGQHTFKGGAQIERFANQINNGQQFPNISLSWNSSYASLAGVPRRGTYGYYTVVRQYTVGDIHSNNLGMFAQDQWAIQKNLTLNYGVRLDHTNIPSYRPENKGITFGFGSKIAPRVGFAYDVKGDGKWKTYGSWGVFYDIEKLEMPLGAFGAQHWISYYWQLDDYNWPAINCDGTPTSGCPGTFIEQVDFRHVSNGNSTDPNAPNANLIDPNLQPYKSEEVTFGMDHDLGRRMSIGTRYTHKWIDTAIEDVGVDVLGVGEVFYLANPGVGYGAYPMGTSFPKTPDPKRHYDGLELTFRRRLDAKWMLNSSLLISRTWGNYSGLTSSDENGRNSPNVNRYFDLLYLSFDQKVHTTYGRLASDRPYVVKIQPAYILPWGTMAGAEIDVESGLPQSSSINFNNVPIFIYNRNDLGRMPTFSYVNLNFQQSFRMPGGRRVTASLNIDNLFDQKTVTGIGTSPYNGSMTFTQCAGLPDPAGTPAGTGTKTCSDLAFFAGFDIKTVEAAVHSAAILTNPVSTTGNPNALYKLASSFQGARSARFEIKFSF